jgi:arylsulfatase A-like enzyme
MKKNSKPSKFLYFSITRRDFLKITGGFFIATFFDKFFKFEKILAEEIKPKKPNIILILADDLGYNELSCYGCKDIPTPNIDSIANNGVRFTQGYVTCPVCAPTRAGLLTGRYQQRFGFETNPGPEEYADEKFGLPLDQPTLAERLKKEGYVTALIGKWHLGYKPELTPTKRGFDEFFGFLSGAHNYLSATGSSKLLRGMEKVVDEKEYLTNAFTRESVAFIKKNKDKPFFLYLSFNAVHSPLQATEKYIKRVEGINDPTRLIFGAMKIAMDDAVGYVLNTLKKEGLEENTIIFFLSDNGRTNPSDNFKQLSFKRL